MIDLNSNDTIENETIEGLKEIESLSGKFFSGCIFRSCNFSNTDFFETTFEDCEFYECNFSFSGLVHTGFRGVKFHDSKLLSLNFTKCDQFVVDFEFNKCLIQGCGFSDMKLDRVSFINSTISDCDFFNSSLISANFRGSDLGLSNFLNTDLRKANFTNAKNYSISPINNKIEKAVFDLPEAINLLKEFRIVIK